LNGVNGLSEPRMLDCAAAAQAAAAMCHCDKDGSLMSSLISKDATTT